MSDIVLVSVIGYYGKVTGVNTSIIDVYSIPSPSRQPET